jgi:hypothetical protein
MDKDINNNLYGWLFTYNCYKKIWYAFKSEHLNEVWNGGADSNPNVLKADNKDSLISFINSGQEANQSSYIDYDTKS